MPAAPALAPIAFKPGPTSVGLGSVRSQPPINYVKASLPHTQSAPKPAAPHISAHGKSTKPFAEESAHRSLSAPEGKPGVMDHVVGGTASALDNFSKPIADLKMMALVPLLGWVANKCARVPLLGPALQYVHGAIAGTIEHIYGRNLSETHNIVSGGMKKLGLGNTQSLEQVEQGIAKAIGNSSTRAANAAATGLERAGSAIGANSLVSGAASSIRNAPAALGGRNMHTLAWDGMMVGMATTQIYGQAKTFGAQVTMIENARRELTGQPPSLTWLPKIIRLPIMMMGNNPPLVREMAGDALKQFLLPTGAQGAALFAHFKWNGANAHGMTFMQQLVRQLPGLLIVMFSNTVASIFTSGGVNEAVQLLDQNLANGAPKKDAYALFIVGATAQGKRVVDPESPTVQLLAGHYAAMDLNPSQVMNKILVESRNGTMDATAARLRNEAGAADAAATAPAPAPDVEVTPQIAQPKMETGAETSKIVHGVHTARAVGQEVPATALPIHGDHSAKAVARSATAGHSTGLAPA